MNDFKIQHFTNYVLRTPAFPVLDYLQLLENYSDDALLKIYKNAFFSEALHIASFELKKELDKWIGNPNTISQKKKEALAQSLLKYFARISCRCTPFGLFAGCSVGKFSDKTEIQLKKYNAYQRFTQFDSHYWVALLQHFSKRKDLIANLVFYPNNSLYVVGDFYRFVEYKYVNTKREHSISALRKSTLIETLVDKATVGVKIHELIPFLIDDVSETKDALEFIYELIEMQFLVSHLDASLTVADEWEKLFDCTKNNQNFGKEYSVLKQLKHRVGLLDEKVVADAANYENCKDLLQQIEIPFNEKTLFQTDLKITSFKNKLNENTSKKVIQALYFLNGIQPKNENQSLEQFKKAFLAKYESQELPLTFVLDTEIGIGFLQDNASNDSHSILEQFSFKQKINPIQNEVWTANDFILESKLQHCNMNSELKITLTEKDFPNFDSNWNATPPTFSTIIELTSTNSEEQVVLTSTGNVSATKLLGRFCSSDDVIHNLVTEIIDKETHFNSSKILAEIVHIPESRTGNILKRPVLREYEIPYLANRGVALEKTIGVDDLMVSIQNGRIYLRSIMHNKEVVPCLSNAHNYSNNSLPIYHFLCSLQSQNLKPIYNFDWGVLKSHYTFFPQVVYKNVILSKANWIVTKKELEQFKTSDEQLLAHFTDWRIKRGIPKKVSWIHFDNSLLLDFEQLVCVELFLESVGNYTKITLEEFLFTNDLVVKNEEGLGFINQFILSFYKE